MDDEKDESKITTTVVLEFTAEIKVSNDGYLSDKDPVKDHVQKALDEVSKLRWHYSQPSGTTQPVAMKCRVKTVQMTPIKDVTLNGK